MGRNGPNARRSRSASATVYGDLIYVIGGLEEDAVSSRIDVYEPGSDSWSEGPPLLTGRSHMSAVTLGRLIYVIGGKDETGVVSLDLVEALDPTTGAWAEVRGLNVGRSSLGALEPRDGSSFGRREHRYGPGLSRKL